MRDVAAFLDQHLCHWAADMFADGIDLIVTAKLVIVALYHQKRAGDVGQFVNHVPVAKFRLAPCIDP